MNRESLLKREEMAQTLNRLNEKLVELEHRVSGTVKTVKSSASAVRDTFDIKCQVDHRPWTFLVGATALGFLAGAGPNRNKQTENNARFEAPAEFDPKLVSNWLSKLGSTFEPELAELKGILIGTIFGILRDVVINEGSERADHPSLDGLADTNPTAEPIVPNRSSNG